MDLGRWGVAVLAVFAERFGGSRPGWTRPEAFASSRFANGFWSIANRLVLMWLLLLFVLLLLVILV